MAEITASMVKELRERTDAPMMDCKKVLVEAEGDMAKAEELLRARLGNKLSKAAARVAAEGTVGVYVSADGKQGAIVEVNCETDFVAKNDDFLALTRNLADVVATQNPADVAALSALKIGDEVIEDARAQLIGKIGENITIRRFANFSAKGKLASYIHGGKIGVVVDLVGGEEALAKDIAMHIAASKPVALSRDDVPAELIEKERSIATQKAAESGKPEFAAKMIEGSVQKFLKDVALLDQVFVKDPAGKQTIEQLLKANNASIAAFTMYVVGEGIEKKVTDFAAEVAAAAKI
ncbi:MAG: elongation factor Ts [Betaproteobacteria bacterium HGW-Betaproteobacteria-1]|jgi:elongation factor Ts|nr:MAG: elongation factor Ts [Betaproteobacteria bacterium HGW-Betaproteobacteria-1]